MSLSTYLKYGSVGMLGIIVLGELYHFMAIKIRDKLRDADEEDELTEIVFCREVTNYKSRLTRGITFNREPMQHATEILENLISSANCSIYLAMYIFTSDPLATALIEAHNRGVKISIIVDHSMETASSTKIRSLHNHGVSVRVCDSSTLHHKLCLIDVFPKPVKVKRKSFSTVHIPQSGITITGSLNWTREALLSNEENFLVTSNKSVCQASLSAFMKLWAKSRTIVDS